MGGDYMKIKRNSLIILIAGVLILGLGILSPVVYWNSFTLRNQSAGIIGGAGAPTYMYVTFNLFWGLPLVFILLGLSMAVSAGFCLLFKNTIKTYCSVKTSAISIGLSAIGALGLACAFIWLSIVSFGEVSRHPVEYPITIFLGIVSFFVFVALIALYLKLRKMNWSVKGFVIDIFTSLIYLPTFFFAISFLYNALG
jgi:hypothetical protein